MFTILLVSMATDDYLTENDEKLLDRIEQGWSIKKACDSLNIAYSTGRVRLHNIRIKFTKSTNTHNRLIARGKKNSKLKFLLAPIRRESFD